MANNFMGWQMSSQTHKPKIRFQDFPDEGFIRLQQVLSLHVVPYSASTLWRRVRTHDFPSPTRISPGITAWKVGDIRAYLDALGKSSTGGAA